MSDLPFDIEEQRARIHRAQEEAEKFSAETRKLIAEREKLTAEAEKFRRDRTIAPWLAGGAIAGGILTLANLVLRAFGLSP